MEFLKDLTNRFSSCLSVTCERDSQEMEFLKDLTNRFSSCLSVTCERDSQEMEFLKDLTNRFSSCLSVTCERDSQEMEFLKELTNRFSSCLSVTCERDSQEMEFLKDLTNRFSSFHHLTRVVAWIQRFHHNSKFCKNDRQILPVLQSSEVSKAKKTLIRLAQQSSFAGVFSLIWQGNIAKRTLPTSPPA